MRFIPRDDKTWLCEFTNSYNKTNDISKIKASDLKNWGLLTGTTNGQYVAEYGPPNSGVTAPRAYAGQKALIAIETLAVLRGSLSPRALALVTEWAVLHRAELMEDWALAREEAQLNPIAPLE